MACPRPTLACARPPGMGFYDQWSWDPYAGGYESEWDQSGYGYPAEGGYGDDWSEMYGSGGWDTNEYWFDEGSGWDPGEGR